MNLFLGFKNLDYVPNKDILYESIINPSDAISNNSAISNNTRLVHWPLMGGLLHLVQDGTGWAAARLGPSSLYQM